MHNRLYESASHRVRVRPLQVTGISGLDRQDQQLIFETVPAAMRQHSLMQQPKMVGDALPSVYELLKANLKGNTLDNRYRELLRELEQISS